MVVTSSADDSPHSVRSRAKTEFWPLFWLLIWFGTSAAGGVFGLFAGGVAGLFVGTIFAALVGAPVVITFAVLTWACWLSRFVIPPAVCSGASTGIIATAMTWNPIFNFPFGFSVCLAGVIGGAGAGICAQFFREKCREKCMDSWPAVSPWRFSLRDLFVRITVIAILVAGWTWVTKSYLNARAQSRARLQEIDAQSQRLNAGKPD